MRVCRKAKAPQKRCSCLFPIQVIISVITLICVQCNQSHLSLKLARQFLCLNLVHYAFIIKTMMTGARVRHL